MVSRNVPSNAAWMSRVLSSARIEKVAADMVVDRDGGVQQDLERYPAQRLFVQSYVRESGPTRTGYTTLLSNVIAKSP